MARRIVHQLVDDIDGTVMGVGEGESLHFSVNGVSYEMDLSTENAAAFRKVLDPYIAAARRSSSAGIAPRKRSPRSNPEVGNIREWAAENGFTVSDRGRIPAPIIEAYRAAH